MRLPFLICVSVALLCACGGGGSTNANPPVVTPTTGPSVAPSTNPSAKPTVKPSSPATVAPSPAPKPTTAPTTAPTGAPASLITHIVVIIQENRSFDNLFTGFPNANTQNFGVTKDPLGQPTTVPLAQIPLAVPCDISHSHTAWAGDWDNGKMDGFAAKTAPTNCLNGTPPPHTYAYSYVNPNDIASYWSMAHNYTLMDGVFEDPTSPSFESHLHLISGQSNNTSENPMVNGQVQSVWGCDSPTATRVPLYNGLGDTTPGIFPCFPPPYSTVADLLDAKGLKWKYYAPAVGSPGDIWSAFDAISAVRFGADWANVISPQTRILTEAASIPSVTYVVPSFADSDHASANSATGPSWVAAVVNAIGTSPNWNNTAIFLLWDDWGGWYDHVAPTVSANYTVGGFRIPVICISPYSEQLNPASPVVDHTVHGMDGILSFIESNFGLPSLNQQDALDSPLSSCFNFKQSPRAFVPVPSAAIYPPAYFKRERQSYLSPDTDQ